MKIKINCSTDHSLPISELTEFQGNLKTRSELDIARIQNSILEYGFAFPFFVWKKGKVNNVIDGHGRLESLTQLENDGYEIPPLPVIYIKATSVEKAKELLLNVNSVYGVINERMLRELIDECGANVAELSFPEINLEFNGAFEPFIAPEFDRGEVTDGQINTAMENFGSYTTDDEMAEFECHSCGGGIFIKRSVIERYLRGDYV